MGKLYENRLRDLDAEQITGVQIENKKLWVCVDGECVLRVRTPEIEVTDNRDIWLTATEAAELLKIPVSVFRNLCSRGQGPESSVVNGTNRFNQREVEEWSQARKPNQSEIS